MGGWDAPWHWIVLAVVVIALFGYKKLPDASRALGRSLRIFKTEIKGMGQDDRIRETARDTDRKDADVTPRAETVRNSDAVPEPPPAIEAPRARPRPTPSPTGRPRVESDASGPGAAR